MTSEHFTHFEEDTTVTPYINTAGNMIGWFEQDVDATLDPDADFRHQDFNSISRVVPFSLREPNVVPISANEKYLPPENSYDPALLRSFLRVIDRIHEI